MPEWVNKQAGISECAWGIARLNEPGRQWPPPPSKVFSPAAGTVLSGILDGIGLLGLMFQVLNSTKTPSAPTPTDHIADSITRVEQWVGIHNLTLAPLTPLPPGRSHRQFNSPLSILSNTPDLRLNREGQTGLLLSDVIGSLSSGLCLLISRSLPGSPGEEDHS